jgi:hypothetical protein
MSGTLSFATFDLQEHNVVLTMKLEKNLLVLASKGEKKSF